MSGGEHTPERAGDSISDPTSGRGQRQVRRGPLRAPIAPASVPARVPAPVPGGRSRHSGPSAAGSGGTRAALRPAVIALASALTATVVGWGILVVAAVDFGISARTGETGDWWFLALATMGAIACLLLAILLLSRILEVLRRPTASPAPVRPAGGKRRAR